MDKGLFVTCGKAAQGHLAHRRRGRVLRNYSGFAPMGWRSVRNLWKQVRDKLGICRGRCRTVGCTMPRAQPCQTDQITERAQKSKETQKTLVRTRAKGFVLHVVL